MLSFVDDMISKIEKKSVYCIEDLFKTISPHAMLATVDMLTNRALNAANETGFQFNYSRSEIVNAVHDLKIGCSEAESIISDVPEDVNIPKYYSEFMNGCYELIWGAWPNGACRRCPKCKETFCLLKMMRVAREMLYPLHYVDKEQLNFNFHVWDSSLYGRGSGSGVGKGYKYLVSFAPNLRSLCTRYDIISCSVVGDGHYQTYQNREYGFLFHPKEYELLGMSPSDSTVSAYKYSLRDELTMLAEILFGNTVFSDRIVLRGILTDFQACWQMNDFMKRTKTYNEVVLRGETEPIGIFAMQNALQNRADELYAACRMMDLPLVVLNPETGISSTHLYCKSAIQQSAKELFYGI